MVTSYLCRNGAGGTPPSLGALGNLRYGAEFEANAPVPEVLVLGGREPHRLG